MMERHEIPIDLGAEVRMAMERSAAAQARSNTLRAQLYSSEQDERSAVECARAVGRITVMALGLSLDKQWRISADGKFVYLEDNNGMAI